MQTSNLYDCQLDKITNPINVTMLNYSFMTYSNMIEDGQHLLSAGENVKTG